MTKMTILKIFLIIIELFMREDEKREFFLTDDRGDDFYPLLFFQSQFSTFLSFDEEEKKVFLVWDIHFR